MKNKLLYIIASAALIFALPSCLDEVVYSSIGEFEDSNDGADQAVTGAYSQFLNDMFRWDHFPAVLDYDNDYITGPDWALRYLGAGNFQSGNYDYSTDPLWDHVYVLIHRANAGIESIEKMNNVDAKRKANNIGELKFLKALGYFWLVRAYGEIPVHYKSVNAGSDFNQPRQPIATVYKHITELLLDAESEIYKNTDGSFRKGHASAGTAAGLLAKVYLTMASGSADEGTQIIVKGGKARNSDNSFTDPQANTFQSKKVEGYVFDKSSTELFTLARNKAFEVMSGNFGNYDLLPYDQLWSIAGRGGAEHLFSVQPKDGDNEYGLRLSWYYTGTEDASGMIIDGLIIGCRDHWYKLFESNDLRIVKGVMHRFIDKSYHESWNGGGFYPNNKEWSIMARGFYEENGDSIYNDPVTGQPYIKDAMFNDGRQYVCDQEATPDKYIAHLMKYYYATDRTKIRSDVPFPVLRYADILLIFAEAENEVNPLSADAFDALNKVRTRSYASAKSTTNISTKMEFRSEVLDERARELALEGDRRWDLIRWGIYLDVMNKIGTDEASVNKTREKKHLLFPIPVSEMLTNKAITNNNFGW
ncbi:MAG: RagB/SusD family nutrient uptake outer membrane protein [Prevotellaceae bacterium]|jgi:hypothetical protein|nr:RagB/SusD family nutrient uptake outer membrane protein [Prevotellaceae bacterium]